MTLASRPKPFLPLEILLSILEVPFAVDTWELVLTKPYQLLLVNRTTCNRLLSAFYRTVVLKSPTQLAQFFETIRLSSHLGRLVCNLWVCTFDSGNASTQKFIGDTLSLGFLSTYTPNLQRLALPKLIEDVEFIVPSKESLLSRLHTLHVHSTPSRAFFLYGISGVHLKNLQRLFITLPSEAEEGDSIISSSLWAVALVAAISDRATSIKELVLNVPAHPLNEACVGKISTQNSFTAIVRVSDKSKDEEEVAIYESWRVGGSLLEVHLASASID
ncbi:hypothetical protein FRC12_014515 [Ceratobasidium sp. 428]|nr:hypothetical protein FRC12_014515 [Ceratobasidium sp. 428]